MDLYDMVRQPEVQLVAIATAGALVGTIFGYFSGKKAERSTLPRLQMGQERYLTSARLEEARMEHERSMGELALREANSGADIEMRREQMEREIVDSGYSAEHARRMERIRAVGETLKKFPADRFEAALKAYQEMVHAAPADYEDTRKKREDYRAELFEEFCKYCTSVNQGFFDESVDVVTEEQQRRLEALLDMRYPLSEMDAPCPPGDLGEIIALLRELRDFTLAQR